LARIEERIAEVVDRMKTSRDAIGVVVVGGGSVLLGDSLPGASELIKPPHFAVANAIGAVARSGDRDDLAVAGRTQLIAGGIESHTIAQQALREGGIGNFRKRRAPTSERSADDQRHCQ
jgi:hypothetical protein